MENSKMILLNYEGSIDFTKVVVNDYMRIGDLIKEHLPQFANSSDYNEDIEAYIQNEKDELSKDAKVSELGLQEGDVLHFSRCSKIDVTIHYGDKEVILDDLRPSLALKRVERQAIRELKIEASGKQFEFRNRTNSESLSEKLPLGSLTTYPSCKASLNLVLAEEKVKEIIVNGRPKPFSEKKISFEQVIVLAFGQISNHPQVFYTVTYKGGHSNKPEGSLVRGQEIRVKNKMIFNATCTDKS